MTYEDVKKIRENPTMADVDNDELYKMVDVAIEKQIPKIPITWGDTDGEWSCTSCGTSYKIRHNYCPNCGQAIDFSEE